MSTQSATPAVRPADPIDVRKTFGNLEDAMVVKVLGLKPSLADLEDAAVCMAGEHDVLAKSGHHVPVTAARIIELLTARE